MIMMIMLMKKLDRCWQEIYKKNIYIYKINKKIIENQQVL